MVTHGTCSTPKLGQKIELTPNCVYSLMCLVGFSPRNFSLCPGRATCLHLGLQIISMTSLGEGPTWGVTLCWAKFQIRFAFQMLQMSHWGSLGCPLGLLYQLVLRKLLWLVNVLYRFIMESEALFLAGSHGLATTQQHLWYRAGCSDQRDRNSDIWILRFTRYSFSAFSPYLQRELALYCFYVLEFQMLILNQNIER